MDVFGVLFMLFLGENRKSPQKHEMEWNKQNKKDVVKIFISIYTMTIAINDIYPNIIYEYMNIS